MRLIIDILFGNILCALVAFCPLSLFAQETVVMEANAEERKVAPFTSVDVQSGMVVYLAQGGTQGLAVSASEKGDLAKIITEVNDGVLTIKVDYNGMGSWKGNRKLRAYVTLERLDAVSASGGSIVKSTDRLQATTVRIATHGGSIVTLNLQATSMQVSLHGGSIATISGSSNAITAEISGGSILKAKDMKAQEANIEAGGGSVVSFWAEKKISLDAGGGSVVTMHGNATNVVVKKGGGAVVSQNSGD